MTDAPSDANGGAHPAALEQLRASVEAYYTRKIRTFGATPLGVDWPSTPSLELRLVQLLKVCDFSTPFSLNDLGCGYAAALDLIGTRWPANQVDYLGVDLSADMIAHARLQQLQPVVPLASYRENPVDGKALMRFLRMVDPRFVVSFHQPLHGVDVSTPGMKTFATRLARGLDAGDRGLGPWRPPCVSSVPGRRATGP